MYIAFSEKSVLLEHVTENVLHQSEINSCKVLLGMSGVVCLFILVTLLKYCKKFYSKRRNNINQMSQEDDLFHNEYTFQRKDQAILYQLEQGRLKKPSETEYDEFNKIFHTRCANSPEPVTVLLMKLFPSSKPICLGK